MSLLLSLASTSAAGHVAVSAAKLDKHASNSKTASDCDENTGEDEEQNEEDGEKIQSSVSGKTAETKETAVVTQSKATKPPAKNAAETTKKPSKQTSLSLDSASDNTAETQVPEKETAVPVSTKTAPAATEKTAKTRGEKNAKAAATAHSRCTCIYVNVVVNKKFMFI